MKKAVMNRISPRDIVAEAAADALPQRRQVATT
jgi:hypothetical protein